LYLPPSSLVSSLFFFTRIFRPLNSLLASLPLTIPPFFNERTNMPVNPDSYVEEKERMKKFHGSIVEEKSGLVTSFKKVTQKNEELNAKAVDTYYSNWEDRKDIKNTEEGVQKRRANAQIMTNAFYDLVTDFYEYGWGQSFHFCQLYKGDTFEENTNRHEAYLSVKLGLKRGMKVLDVGCGVGGPLREVVKSSGGAHVTGLNNNAYQIERCEAYSRKYGLTDFTAFIKGDFTKMPIADATFDAVFSVEATVHAPKLEMVYGEIFRVLKPGGKYACYEWCVTEKYDENDLFQKKIVHGIEEGNSISKMYKTTACLNAAKSVGFIVLEEGDVAPVTSATEPWYYALSNASGLRGFARSPIGRVVTHTTVTILQALYILPAGVKETSALLNDAADKLIQGGELGIFTPMYFFLVQKPHAA
ncbi:Delta(24)-sterol C-methyltransferase, partial [Jimgerdemannia flammicorona]